MNVGFLITARLKSSRLPLKLLLPLRGKTIIERVIERTRKVALVKDIVLCTSPNPQDKPLVDIALDNNIYYFLGSEEDVLQRLLDAAKFFRFDYIINITGENPLFSIYHANQVSDLLTKGIYDFVYIKGLPIGCAVYGMKTKALEVICKVKKIVDTEIWGYLINRPEIFDLHAIEVDDYFKLPELRITTDYIEDYLFVNKLYGFFPDDHIPSFTEVMTILKENPEIQQINAHRTQLDLDDAIKQKINEFYEKEKDQVLKIKQDIYNNL